MTNKCSIYIRVSSLDQERGIESQERAIREYLANHGITDAVLYQDRLSGKDLKRPGFERLQQDIFKGKVKTVVVWKLDRLSRSIKDGINVLTDWLEKGVRVVAIQQQFDFSGVTGQLVAAVLLAVAQWERESLRENTKRGIQAAKARGVKFEGRKPKLFAAVIVPLVQSGLSMSAVAEQLKCTRPAIYDALKREGFDIKKLREGSHDHQKV